MKKALLSIFIMFSVAAMAQPNKQLDLTKFQSYLKSVVANGARPLDGKLLYRDSITGLQREFQSVAEARLALVQLQRSPGLTVVINSGGTLSNGVITGGTNNEYWWRAGKTDGALVLKTNNFIGMDSFAVKAKSAYIFSNDSLALTGTGITNAPGTAVVMAMSTSGRVYKSTIPISDLGKNLYTVNGNIPANTNRMVGIPESANLTISTLIAGPDVRFTKTFGSDGITFDKSVLKHGGANDSAYFKMLYDDDGDATPVLRIGADRGDGSESGSLSIAPSGLSLSNYSAVDDVFTYIIPGAGSAAIGVRKGSAVNDIGFLKDGGAGLRLTGPLSINSILPTAGQVIGNVGGIPKWVTPSSSGTGTSSAAFTDSLSALNMYTKGGLVLGDSILNQSDSIVVYDDSYATGAGASDPKIGYAPLLAMKLKATLVNKAIAGTRLTYDHPGDSSLIERVSGLPFFRNTLRYIFIGYQVNDVGSGVDAPSFVASEKRILDTLMIGRGWPASKIVLVSKNTATSTLASRFVFSDSIQALSIRNGTQFVDVSRFIKQNGWLGNSNPDSIHYNDIGHYNLMSAILYRINSGALKVNGTLTVKGDIDLSPKTYFRNNISFGPVNEYQDVRQVLNVDGGASNYRMGTAYNQITGGSYFFGRSGFTTYIGQGDASTLTTSTAPIWLDGNNKMTLQHIVGPIKMDDGNENKLLWADGGTSTSRAGISYNGSATGIFGIFNKSFPICFQANGADISTVSTASSALYISGNNDVFVNSPLQVNNKVSVVGKLTIGDVPVYDNNAEAVTAGLAVGTVYRTGDLLKIVHD